MRFKAGDVVTCTSIHANGVVREITDVREGSGYTWQYPDMPEKGEWYTENSCDPLLELGWKKVG